MKSRNLIFPKIEKENKEIRKRAIKATDDIKTFSKKGSKKGGKLFVCKRKTKRWWACQSTKHAWNCYYEKYDKVIENDCLECLWIKGYLRYKTFPCHKAALDA